MTESDDRMNETTQVVRPLSSPSRGKGWIIGLICLMVLLLVVLLERMNSVSSDVASVKTDVSKKADTEYVDQSLSKLDKKVELADQKLNQDINKKLDDDIAKLRADLDSKADKDDMAKKADKDELSGLATRTRLKRVERKLDDYIADKETAPPAYVENKPAPADDGTVNLIVHPIPVVDEE